MNILKVSLKPTCFAYNYILLKKTKPKLTKVILQFPSIVELLDFSLVTDITNCEIDKKHLTMVCILPEADIELAKHAYDAIILAPSL